MRSLKRRRKEGKTDYLKRIKLLKSESPRIVFRKTNKYLIAQYIISKEAQDEIKFGLTTKKLLEYGWPKEALGGLKSLSASYLLGFLMGHKITKGKLTTPIIDFGMLRTIHKTKLYAFIKGLLDADIKIKYQEKTLPEEERLKTNKKISLDKIKEQIQK